MLLADATLPGTSLLELSQATISALNATSFPSSEEDEHTEGRAASPNPSGNDTAVMNLVATDPVKSWIREGTPADANTQD